MTEKSNKAVAPLVSNLPIWQFMFAYRPKSEERSFRQHYLDADIKQVISITLTVVVLMVVMSVADYPNMTEISGLGAGIVARFVLLIAGVFVFWLITRFHKVLTVDLSVASYAFLAACCVVAFNMAADISAVRIGMVSTLFIFVANITYPVYSLYILPAVLVVMLGDTVVLMDSSREDLAQYWQIMIIVFAFAEVMSLFASAHLQRTRYAAFRALAEVKTLSGMIPICAHCNKIRDDSGYYQQLEKYISAHSGAVFSHGVCPDCVEEFYGEYRKSVAAEKDSQHENKSAN